MGCELTYLPELTAWITKGMDLQVLSKGNPNLGVLSEAWTRGQAWTRGLLLGWKHRLVWAGSIGSWAVVVVHEESS
ncbi:hypothetical protein HanXRQr2_Chr13g0588281 [Helianthus annuus]|uniref:Uncharacterized protein n=1 Tax=Helianthus annuus TaxID=4232 RepID=A0A251SSP2_HELAN|nr:hypothetical protein HanXRQr2_Chr13g0588281 [Helianthus annuus]KAJ0476903.1 hypothetical protein HanHA300_Chr13g0482431 [Helianthus annuus]KAJ0497727.1 hypothetical protein HanHA89_Chr13g0514461 [Helianthus annuus]KAJ0663738.1 hypothetical protein HanLR1_Chr13g0484401 [Helianthus annuus]KAJ0849238.1 hypothetical protein HanPSC8_Chr13g0566531 [Helianthus annuus]